MGASAGLQVDHWRLCLERPRGACHRRAHRSAASPECRKGSRVEHAWSRALSHGGKASTKAPAHLSTYGAARRQARIGGSTHEAGNRKEHARPPPAWMDPADRSWLGELYMGESDLQAKVLHASRPRADGKGYHLCSLSRPVSVLGLCFPVSGFGF